MTEIRGPKSEPERLRERRELAARLLLIADQIAANMPDDVTSDHSWLYDDETGLPK